jgi:hypothetical protein
MQLSTKRRIVFGLSTVGLTTGGLLASGFGLAAAQADSTAAGGAADSPGVLSGNLVQIPVNVPVNVCGNQVAVIGVLDSVVGNTCTNAGGSAAGGSGAGATAAGAAVGSPGVLSGNLVQAPVNVPVNVCGNQVAAVGVGDTDAGNSCSNGAGPGQPSAPTATAAGAATGSPGVGSGNNVEVPVNAPVNVCGNQATVISVLDTVAGGDCSNGGVIVPGGPASATTPDCGCTPPAPPATRTSHDAPAASSEATGGSLAETGTGMLGAIPFIGGLLGGGTLLTRRFGAAPEL